jgi:hypothetical protein
MIANYVKAGLICLCVLGMSNNSVAQTSDSPIKNIVLVPGAWADGSGWKGVYDILVKDGYNVSTSRNRRHHFRTTSPLRVWGTSRPTCRTSERTRLTTESAFQVTSANLRR